MNIAILSTSYFPDSNGAAIRTDGLAFGLHQWGHRVVIFTPGTSYTHEKNSYADIYRIPVKRSIFANILENYTKFNYARHRAFSRFVFSLFEKEKIDIVHTRQPLDFFTIGKEAKKRHYFWTTEAHKFLSKTDYENDLISRRRYERLLAKELHLINQSDLVVTMTLSGKKTLQTEGVTTDIVPVSNATRIHPLAEGNFVFDKHFHYLLYAGTIRKVEAVEDVVHICSQLKKTLPIKLLILGKGQLQPLYSLVKKFRMDNDVFFLGEIPFSQIGYFYAHATLFIQPRPDLTYHRDIIGLKCYDALACGLPLVVSDVGGLGDFVTKHKVGVTFPAGNYEQCVRFIQRILSDTRTYSLLKKNAKRISKQLTWKRACKPLHQKFQQLQDSRLK